MSLRTPHGITAPAPSMGRAREPMYGGSEQVRQIIRYAVMRVSSHTLPPSDDLGFETISPGSSPPLSPALMASSLARSIARQHLSMVGGVASLAAHILPLFDQSRSNYSHWHSLQERLLRSHQGADGLARIHGAARGETADVRLATGSCTNGDHWPPLHHRDDPHP